MELLHPAPEHLTIVVVIFGSQILTGFVILCIIDVSETDFGLSQRIFRYFLLLCPAIPASTSQEGFLSCGIALHIYHRLRPRSKLRPEPSISLHLLLELVLALEHGFDNVDFSFNEFGLALNLDPLSFLVLHLHLHLLLLQSWQ